MGLGLGFAVVNNAEFMFCLGNTESVERRRDLTFGLWLMAASFGRGERHGVLILVDIIIDVIIYSTVCNNISNYNSLFLGQAWFLTSSAVGKLVRSTPECSFFSMILDPWVITG